MRPRAVGRHAAGLLGQKRDRVGLVHQPQLALRVRLGRRIEEDAALEQRAMEVGDQRADVARRIRPARRAGAQVRQVAAIGSGKLSALASLTE